MARPRVLPVFFAALASLVSSGAQALELTFDDALRRAEQGPAAQAGQRAAATLDAARPRVPAIESLPQVQVMAGPQVSPQGALATQTVVTQALSLAPLQGAQRATLSAEAALVRAEISLEVLERRRHTASAWLRLRMAEQAVASATEEQALATKRRAGLARLQAAGEATRAELAAADVEVAQADQTLSDAKAARTAAEVKLVTELGLAATEPARTTGALPSFDVPTGAEATALLAAVDKLPEAARQRASAEVARAQAREESARKAPQLTVGAQGEVDSLGGVVVFGLVGAQLPVVDLSARTRATLSAAETRAEGQAAQAARDAKALVAQALLEAEQAATREAELDKTWLPAAAKLVEARKGEQAAGTATALEVLEAERGLVRARRELAAARARTAEARVSAALLVRSLRTALTGPRP